MLFGHNTCFAWHECSRSRRVHKRWGLCRWNRRTSPGVHLILNLKICTFIRHTWEMMIFGQNKCFVWHECSQSRRVHMRWGLCRWNRGTSPEVHLALNLKTCTFIRHTYEIMIVWPKIIISPCAPDKRASFKLGIKWTPGDVPRFQRYHHHLMSTRLLREHSCQTKHLFWAKIMISPCVPDKRAKFLIKC